MSINDILQALCYKVQIMGLYKVLVEYTSGFILGMRGIINIIWIWILLDKASMVYRSNV